MCTEPARGEGNRSRLSTHVVAQRQVYNDNVVELVVRTFCFTKRDFGPSVGGGSVTVRDDGDVPMVMAIYTMAVEVSHGIYARWVARVLKGLITAIFPSEIRTMVIVHVGWYLL